MKRNVLLSAVSALLLGASALILSACVAGGRFETDYQPLSPEVSRGWRLAEVQIDVPRSLTVSEARTLLPEADIVWREDPLGEAQALAGAERAGVGGNFEGKKKREPLSNAELIRWLTR